MAFGTKVGFGEVRELDFGSISGTFTPVGTPIGDHVRILALQNSTNQDLYVSFDGVTNNIRMATNSFKLLDFSSNKIRDDGMFLAVGTQIFVKEVLGSATTGAFWAEVIFGEGGK